MGPAFPGAGKSAAFPLVNIPNIDKLLTLQASGAADACVPAPAVLTGLQF